MVCLLIVLVYYEKDAIEHIESSNNEVFYDEDVAKLLSKIFVSQKARLSASEIVAELQILNFHTQAF